MRRAARFEEKETAADHLVAGVLSALAMLATVLVGVLLAVLHTGPDIAAVFWSVHIWGSILVAGAFIVGVVSGPTRMAALYGHFWGTEKPERPYLTLLLWAGVALVVVVTYFAN
jgi:hypothetical protein